MTLHKLLRKGSKGMEQARGMFGYSGGHCCCAVGAIVEASGTLPPGTSLCPASAPAHIYRRLREVVEVEDAGDTSIVGLLFEFNDRLGWSFDEIAEWLEYYDL